MNAKQSFKNVYQLTRLNRGNIHFRQQFFRFEGGGSIYIADSGELVLGRVGEFVSYRPGALAAHIGCGFSLDYRKHTVERSRDAGRVPLP